MSEGGRRVKQRGAYPSGLVHRHWQSYPGGAITLRMTDASKNSREARLAAALRTNLARRKALSRSLGSDDKAAAQAEIKPGAERD